MSLQKKYPGWTVITDRLGLASTYGRDVLMKEVGGEVFVKFGIPDGVQVLGVTPDGRIIAITETRKDSGERYCHLVGGRLDQENESPEDAARRELREETGYEAGTIISLASIKKDSGDCEGVVHYFLASGCRKVAEPEDGIAVTLMRPLEFERMMKRYLRSENSGPKGGGYSIIAFWLARSWLEIREG